MNTLARYDAARAALSACVSVDEVKDWANEGAAREAYARQAKDKEMQKMAANIRMRAKRRLGELMAAQKAAGWTRVGRPRKNGSGLNLIPLAEAGIDKRLAQEARVAAALSPEEFEAAVERRKDAIDRPSLRGQDMAPEAYDPREEMYELAAEAMTIIEADDKLRAAMEEIAKAKRETKTISALYDSVKGEVVAFKRDATRWMKKAQKSALCQTCKASLGAE